MIYKAVVGAHLSDEQAQQYGERLEELQEKHDGATPEVVLSDAQKESSPLHNYFEWDDSRAAREYRLNQARYLLRSIDVVVKIEKVEKPVRAFINVRIRDEDEDKSVYVSAQRVFSDEELRQQTLKRALGQLVSWQNRYKQYQEFGKVFKAIEEVKI